MAQADSSISRIGRFGTLTTVSALGQIVGPVVGGVIIGHTEQPSLPATSSALLVAAWVFVAGSAGRRCRDAHPHPAVDGARGQARTALGSAAQTRDACGATDQLLCEERRRPALGLCAVTGRGRRADVFAGRHSAGYQLQRRSAGAGRDPVLRPSNREPATHGDRDGRRSVVSARPRGQQQHRADDDRDVGARLRARPVADHHHGLGRQPGRRHQPGLGARPAGRNQPRRAGVHPRGSGRGIRGVGESRRPLCYWRSSCSGPPPPGSPAPVAVLSPRVREQRLATSVFGRSCRSSAHRCAKFVAR